MFPQQVIAIVNLQTYLALIRMSHIIGSICITQDYCYWYWLELVQPEEQESAQSGLL